jgi:copper chaperone CopZ
VASGCCGSGDTKKVKTDKDISHYNYKYTISIDGMHCGHCKQSVENELNSIGGTYAVADLNKNNAVLYSKDRCSELQIRNAVTSCGFTAKEIVLCDEK